MAAMVRLLRQVDGIVEETYTRKNEAEESRSREYVSAVKIQAWFRATRCRSYIKHLDKSATAVQRRWRGFLGRRNYRSLVQTSVFIMKLNFYNNMAVKIQKVWRGFYVRKYIYNYHSRKRYLEALQIKNQIVRSELEEYAEQQSQVRQRLIEERERKRKEHAARKNHHLISTEVIPGIYNSPFLPFPSEQEYQLRSVKPLGAKRRNKNKNNPFDPAWKSYDLPRPEKLPPLAVKPQGPFREPQEVQAQRYRGFKPSLRVSSNYFSLDEARRQMKEEEWVARINDDIFLPVKPRDPPYQKLLYTTSEYGQIPYGTKYFREDHLDKHITPSAFKLVVPPIPVFEKLNDTYSQGQV